MRPSPDIVDCCILEQYKVTGSPLFMNFVEGEFSEIQRGPGPTPMSVPDSFPPHMSEVF
jgi:hypothetical protein